MAIRITSGTGRMTGRLECTWNNDVIVRLDPPWGQSFAGLAQLPAAEVEVYPAGDPEMEAIERRMVADAQRRAERTR